MQQAEVATKTLQKRFKQTGNNTKYELTSKMFILEKEKKNIEDMLLIYDFNFQ
jgi:hypothetical protein